MLPQTETILQLEYEKIKSENEVLRSENEDLKATVKLFQVRIKKYCSDKKYGKIEEPIIKELSSEFGPPAGWKYSEGQGECGQCKKETRHYKKLDAFVFRCSACGVIFREKIEKKRGKAA